MEKNINYLVSVKMNGYGYIYTLDEYKLSLGANDEVLENRPSEKEILRALKEKGYNLDDILSITASEITYIDGKEDKVTDIINYK